MKKFSELLSQLVNDGYTIDEARAKVAHDAILYAIHKSGFKSNATIKGGVVMCELTHDMRRTTMDIDLDFIHCSIEETSIRKSVDQWAKTSNLQIVIIGEVKELRQDDYRGKRIYLDISDGTISHPVRTKVDIGVHVQDGINPTFHVQR